MDDLKTCIDCKIGKKREEFHRASNRKDGLQPRCKECNIASAKKWHKDNPDRHEAYWRDQVSKNTRYSSSWYKRKSRVYKITVEELRSLIESSENKCNICGNEPNRFIVIDHCHTSGDVRGVLCEFCNQGLGLFRDNTDYLLNAIEYLNRNNRK